MHVSDMVMQNDRFINGKLLNSIHAGVCIASRMKCSYLIHLQNWYVRKLRNEQICLIRLSRIWCRVWCCSRSVHTDWETAEPFWMTGNHLTFISRRAPAPCVCVYVWLTVILWWRRPPQRMWFILYPCISCYISIVPAFHFQ